jgi:hypothetical protein
MSQHYSNPEREQDEHALPDLEVFQLTATEAAAQNEELVWNYSKRHEFRLCYMNGKVQEAMLEAIVAEEGITGGWFYWYCFPGCLPDGHATGPFDSRAEALAAAREEAAE